MGYKHLTIEEREVIMIGRKNGTSQADIARQLGRCPSSISREIRRNAFGRGYSANASHKRAMQKRKKTRRPSKFAYGPLRDYVDEGLKKYWSPEQIVGRLKRDHPNSEMQVCHETIYRFIMNEAARGVDYAPYLRQGRRRHTYGWRGKKRFKRIRDKKPIESRPVGVESREHLGDWESDTLRGPQDQSDGIVTHVERKTRFTLAAKLSDRKAATLNEATTQLFDRYPELPVLTLTVDNGMEFSEFKRLEETLLTEVYFATPYHSWERGTNENTNGLLRQFFPKKSDLTKITDEIVQRKVDLLNQRPRKCLGYRTPAEAMRDEIVALLN